MWGDEGCKQITANSEAIVHLNGLNSPKRTTSFEFAVIHPKPEFGLILPSVIQPFTLNVLNIDYMPETWAKVASNPM